LSREKREGVRMATFLLLLSLLTMERVESSVEVVTIPVAGGMLELHEGDAVTFPVAGDMSQGCKFLMQRWELERFITCCYSDRRRGETLCDPKNQSPECREAELFRVDEKISQDTSGNCILRLVGGAETGDTGSYTVFFPGQLQDNSEFEVKVAPGTNVGVVGVGVVAIILGAGASGCMLWRAAWFKNTNCRKNIEHGFNQVRSETMSRFPCLNIERQEGNLEEKAISGEGREAPNIVIDQTPTNGGKETMPSSLLPGVRIMETPEENPGTVIDQTPKIGGKKTINPEVSPEVKSSEHGLNKVDKTTKNTDMLINPSDFGYCPLLVSDNTTIRTRDYLLPGNSELKKKVEEVEAARKANKDKCVREIENKCFYASF
jgi:hypothetical protein